MIAHFIFFVCYSAIVLIFTYLDFTNEELKRKNDILEIQLNMNIRLIQITKEVFESLSNKESTYFVNGVIFDEATDNVVAFENLENGKTFTYWKVQE